MLQSQLVASFVDGNFGGGTDVYLSDRLLGTTTLVSHSTVGTANGANLTSSGRAISSDGRFVLFDSYATDLVSGFVDNNGSTSADIYVFDHETKKVSLLIHDPLDPKKGLDANVFLLDVGGK